MSAELYPCRRCKTNSEYSDFCSRKCASEWKGFHEQEIEDLQSQLTAAQAEIARLKAKLEKAIWQRNHFVFLYAGNRYNSESIIKETDKELDSIE